jgi:hypothetical protein
MSDLKTLKMVFSEGDVDTDWWKVAKGLMECIEELEDEVKSCHNDIDAIREADVEICRINEAFKREVIAEVTNNPAGASIELQAIINAAPTDE